MVSKGNRLSVQFSPVESCATEEKHVGFSGLNSDTYPGKHAVCPKVEHSNLVSEYFTTS